MELISYIQSNLHIVIPGCILLIAIITLILNIVWRRHRLKVAPVFANITDALGNIIDHYTFGVRVVNVGNAVAELVDVGICDYSKLTRKARRAITLSQTASPESDPLPMLLHPGQSFTGFFSDAFRRNLSVTELRTVYARTAVGRRYYGRSKDFNNYLKLMRETLQEGI